tara:strand:+ start:5312 stop:6589 length:1278 start_codon:yes stop_codon:yes gene_type:complete
MKTNKLINTPKILEGFGKEKPQPSINSSPAATLPQEELDEIQQPVPSPSSNIAPTPTNNSNNSNPTSNQNPPVSSSPSTSTNLNNNASDGYASSTGSSSKPTRTRPNNYRMSKFISGGPSPLEEKTAIFLHHTGIVSKNGKNVSKNDKCKWICDDHWYNEGNARKSSYTAASNVVLDEAGHIEYLVPYERIAFCQGVTTTRKFQYSNAPGYKKNKKGQRRTVGNPNYFGVSVEVINQGWVRDESEAWILPDRVVKYVDYNGNPKSYKGHKTGEEFPIPQCVAICDWIESLLPTIAPNWKFTPETYKQMWPNITWWEVYKKLKKKGDPFAKQFPKISRKKGDKLPVGYVNYKPYARGRYDGDGNYLSGGSYTVYDDLLFRGKDLWAVSKDVFDGVPGVYTHNSVVSTKSDILPTPNLVNELKKRFS